MIRYIKFDDRQYDDYHRIFVDSYDNIQTVQDGCMVLYTQYDQAVLAQIKDNLCDPEGFRQLVIDCLQKNCKVAIFASIEYPLCIPILLEHGIGLTKEQLSNICMIYNGYDANKNDAYNCYRFIKYIEHCMKLTDIKGRGLVVSSLRDRLLIEVDSKIDYAFYVNVGSEDRSGSLSSGFPSWREVRSFEEERGVWR
ncbi:hypothetical protein [Cardinium endosymbiont of Sogatella furcifera]|uniref:hypothetical protein n=1 Tax=Cardinium endosymbiont of Sogatella furcifera TaxID=650378 RepID=UPI000E0D7162|nr:hypothetical protein [Cardinium endosymbiont of Sogatella furcifera]